MAQSGNGGSGGQWGLGIRQPQLPPKSPRGASSTGHDLQMSNTNESQQGFYGWTGFPQQVGKHHRTFSSMGFVPNAQTAPWLEEVINLPAPKRGMHRRSSSDSLAFVDSHADASALHHPEMDGFDCGSSSTTSIPSRELDKFDEDQLLSMLADIEPFHKQQQQAQEPASAMDIGLMETQTPMSTSENPSTPSDNNSICDNLVDEKPAVTPPAGQLKTEQEVQSVCETEHQPPQEQQQHLQPAVPNTTNGSSSTADPNSDPKRVKRILANRLSAQRSRVRKLQYIADLERSVNALQAEVSTLSPQVAYLDHQRLVLNVDNSALKQRMAALAQDKLFKDGMHWAALLCCSLDDVRILWFQANFMRKNAAHYEALKKEVQRLRQLYQQRQCLQKEEQVKPAEFGSEHQQMQHGNGVSTCSTSETEAHREQMQSENKVVANGGNSSSSNQQTLQPLSCLKAEAASPLAYSSDYMADL
ncbi:Basic leucine zipper 61 [Nymphaea thermarum]|nr:Basic leucine zipper 61 [Nymphaea thermarum]